MQKPECSALMSVVTAVRSIAMLRVALKVPGV